MGRSKSQTTEPDGGRVASPARRSSKRTATPPAAAAPPATTAPSGSPKGTGRPRIGEKEAAEHFELQAKNARLPALHWSFEQHVDDVSIKFLYTPHTLTLLGVTTLLLLVLGLYYDCDAHTSLENARVGTCVALLNFVVLGTLVFPSGPFIRPHPLVWRLVFGFAIAYEMGLIYLLFQKIDDARAATRIFDESYGVPMPEKAYAENCELDIYIMSDRLLDRYVVAHFGGWLAKALVFRDALVLWTMSITWEFIELGFVHVLPNFRECWWDQWILDVLVSNGLGIVAGMQVCRMMESREYTWHSYRDLPTAASKLKRAAMQFSPVSWSNMEWESLQSLKRFAAVSGIIVLIQLSDLNAFFLKHNLYIPSEAPLNIWRMVLYFFVALPAVRQAHSYLTDPTCKRFGTFSYLAILLLLTELILIIKTSRGLFPNIWQPENTWLWGSYLVAYVVVSLAFITRRKKAKAKAKAQ